MTLNSFHDTGLFQCPPNLHLWFSDVFQEVPKKTSVMNVDIHAYSKTEHAFLQSSCTDSSNAFKRYKIPMFSDLS